MSGLLTFQELMHKARSVSICVSDFRYGPTFELKQQNVWAIPARGLVVVCQEGWRPIDADAVRLGDVAYDRTALSNVLTAAARCVGHDELPRGVALVDCVNGEYAVSLAPANLGHVVPLGDGYAKLAVVLREDVAEDGDENEREERNEPAPLDSCAVYVPDGPITTAVPMADVELQDIFDDPARAVILTGCAALAVLTVPHDQSDRLTLPLDDSCLTYPVLEHAMWHLANNIQRGKAGQWLVGLRGEGLEPLVAELWHLGESFSVYVATIASDGLHVRRLLIEKKVARAWLDATHYNDEGK